MAIAPGIYNGSEDDDWGEQVTPDLLSELLAEDSDQCITKLNSKKVEAKISNIGDLVEYMIGDGNVLIHGLARYIPSAISNMTLTNQEIITAVSKGYAKGGGKLPEIFKSYFESESFSCAAEQN